MAWKSLSIDYALKNIIATVIHPGWVQTRLGGEGATLSTKDSVKSIRQVIANLNKKDSGTFVDYKGALLPW
jgi:NAD(P)-dependent dehydrogenase (short-subunit alcohol dehydrogenase family)